MRRYVDQDFETICQWFEAREMSRPNRKDLPKVGMIEDGVAAGFLVQTDSSVAFLEFFVSNPAAGRKKRKRSLDSIADELVKVARSFKFKMIQAGTNLGATQMTALGAGLKFSGMVSMFSRAL